MSTNRLIRVGSPEDLAGAGPYALSADGVDLVAVRGKDGTLHAYEGRCPHRGALLGEGDIEGGQLVCRNHRWRFDVDTGRRIGGPETLASCPLLVRDGAVLADASTLPRASAAQASTRNLKDLPGPRALPLVGNMHQLDMPRLHLTLEDWAKQYGPAYLLRMGPTKTMVVTDPKWADQVLRARPEAFSRMAGLAQIAIEMQMNGVFSAEGADWRPQRRLTVDALAQRNFRSIYPKLVTVADRLKQRWDRFAQTGATVDIIEELKRFTVDVTTLITFGHDLNTIEQEDDPIQRKLELVFPALHRRLFTAFPLWRIIKLPSDRNLDRALAELFAWLNDLLAEARARLGTSAASDVKPSNFLEAMVLARDDNGAPFSDTVIFANLMTMLLAGEDTTAYTLAWAVHELCDSPEAVDALRREADEVLGASTLAREIETVNRLDVAGATANEAMRLRPVAPLLINKANVDTVVGDVLVPAGCGVAVLIRPAAIDPANFEAPASFNPRRWLDHSNGVHEPTAFIPFGSGPRMCPGRSLALVEMRMLLSMLYRNFDVERVGKSSDVAEEAAFTMSPTGLRVRLHARRDPGAEAAPELRQADPAY
jgi:cytochrome P450/nitrite reductase/ring-hydroxylating ferredoxin subunit